MLEKLNELVESLRSTSSNVTKQEILEEVLKENPTLWPYLEAVYHPFRQYNLTHATAMKKGRVSHPGVQPHEETLFKLLAALQSRELSGARALNIWKRYVVCLPSTLQDLAGCILDKDLKCRLGVKTVNKVLKKLGIIEIPTYEVALAKEWDKSPVWEDEEDWYASRKMDGVRCNILLRPGSITFLSRQGKVFETLGVLSQELLDYDGLAVILDGEVALRTADGKDDFQGLMKQIRRKNHTIQEPVFHAFDILYMEGPQWHFRGRQKHLRGFLKELNSARIKRVRQKKVKSEGQLQDLIIRADRKGWEGLILRKDAPYKAGRSKDLLKVKKMKDLEARVVGICHGTMNIVVDGAEKTINVMTRAVIEYKGGTVGVGSGWSVAERRKYFKKPEKLIGKVLTVQYFEETTNEKGGYGLRFPVVKVIHGTKRTT